MLNVRTQENQEDRDAEDGARSRKFNDALRGLMDAIFKNITEILAVFKIGEDSIYLKIFSFSKKNDDYQSSLGRLFHLIADTLAPADQYENDLYRTTALREIVKRLSRGGLKKLTINLTEKATLEIVSKSPYWRGKRGKSIFIMRDEIVVFTHLYREILILREKSGSFPAKLPFNTRPALWLRSEVEDWLKANPRSGKWRRLR